jgi:cytochrome c553
MVMKRILFVIVISLLASSGVQAGDPVAGKEKSQACQACHGADGNSPAPNFPKLAGQYQNYLLRALMDYKSGARKNPIMSAQVAALSEQDMKDLAAYFASQKGLYVLERGRLN